MLRDPRPLWGRAGHFRRAPAAEEDARRVPFHVGCRISEFEKA